MISNNYTLLMVFINIKISRLQHNCMPVINDRKIHSSHLHFEKRRLFIFCWTYQIFLMHWALSMLSFGLLRFRGRGYCTGVQDLFLAVLYVLYPKSGSYLYILLLNALDFSVLFFRFTEVQSLWSGSSYIERIASLLFYFWQIELRHIFPVLWVRSGFFGRCSMAIFYTRLNGRLVLGLTFNLLFCCGIESVFRLFGVMVLYLLRIVSTLIPYFYSNIVYYQNYNYQLWHLEIGLFICVFFYFFELLEFIRELSSDAKKFFSFTHFDINNPLILRVFMEVGLMATQVD